MKNRYSGPPGLPKQRREHMDPTTTTVLASEVVDSRMTTTMVAARRQQYNGKVAETKSSQKFRDPIHKHINAALKRRIIGGGGGPGASPLSVLASGRTINCTPATTAIDSNAGDAPAHQQSTTTTRTTMTPSIVGASSAVQAAPNPPGNTLRDCAGCNKPITERFLLKALDLFWHEDCLKCGCCDCRLGEVGSTLYTKANLILCKRDYLRLFGTTGYCAACNKVIPAFEMVMRAKSNVYHLECFACQQCNHRFCVGDRFYLCDNKILCEYDYEERLVFANIAYNPSSLAHIRRQVSNLQPPGEPNNNGTLPVVFPGSNPMTGRPIMSSPSNPPHPHSMTTTTTMAGMNLNPNGSHKTVPYYSEKPLCGLQPGLPGGVGGGHNGMMCNGSVPPKDDGSSGYGSPDSEIVEAGQAQ